MSAQDMPERIWAHMQCGTWCDRPEDNTEDQVYIHENACLHGKDRGEVRQHLRAAEAWADDCTLADVMADPHSAHRAIMCMARDAIRASRAKIGGA